MPDLSRELYLDATFICSDIYHTQDVLDAAGQFDIVYTSWNYTLSEIFGSLLSAGLTIDFFHEHPFCAWECLPDMEEGPDRLNRFKDPRKRDMLPLTFSLKATKR